MSREPGTPLDDQVFRLSGFVRHRPWCPEYLGPGDCTCDLYALLDSIRCTCGHKVSVHTNRDVDDVVGWPCSECKSARCRGFALAASPVPAPTLDVEKLAQAWANVMDGRRIGQGLNAARISGGTTNADDWLAIAAEYDRLAASSETGTVTE